MLGNPASSLATDSGIGLNYMSAAANNSNSNNQDGDDDVFVEGNNLCKYCVVVHAYMYCGVGI